MAPFNPSITHPRLTDRTILITTPHGIVLTIDPTHAEAVADRLARFVPAYAFGHVASGDYYLVIPKYAETARILVLVTTGALLRLWAESYPAALARLARYGRGATTMARAA